MVDHAMLCIVRHGTPAQRMHGRQVMFREHAPGRVNNVSAAQRPGCLKKALICALKYGLFSHTRPLDAQAVILEIHVTIAVIMAHEQVRLRVTDSTRVRPVKKALQLARLFFHEIPYARIGIFAQQFCCCGKARRDKGAKGSRDRTLFDDETVREIGCGSHIDDSCDRGPDRIEGSGRPVTETDSADGLIIIVAESEHIAVSGEVLSQSLGERNTLSPGAEKYLGGAERARGEYHNIRPYEHRRCIKAFAPGTKKLVVDEKSVSIALDMVDPDLRIYLSAMVSGIRKVVHDEGILRRIIAACNAIATELAGLLIDSHLIHPVSKGDGNRGPVEICLKKSGRLLQRFLFTKRREILRVGKGREHLLSAMVAVFKKRGPIVTKRLWPALILKHPGVGTERYIGINKGCAAETAAHKHVHLLIDPQIVEGGA